MRLVVASLVVAFVVVVAGSSTSTAKGPQLVLAYAGDRGGSLDVYVGTVDDASSKRLTSSHNDEFSPSWSPDGRRIAYRVNARRADTSDIWVMRADGAGRRNVTRNGGLNEYPTWSPDGRSLAFNSHRDGQFEIYSAASTGARQRNLTRNPAKDQWPSWSPDGRLIAFMSDRDGNEDVFVMLADGTGVRNLTRTSDLDESHPVWSPGGGLTFIRHGETGPVTLWILDVDDAASAVRIDTSIEPVFVFAWKPR